MMIVETTTRLFNQNHLPGCRCNVCGSFKIKLGDKFDYCGKVIEVVVLYKTGDANKIGYEDDSASIDSLPSLGYSVIAIHPSVTGKTMITGIYERDLSDIQKRFARSG